MFHGPPNTLLHPPRRATSLREAARSAGEPHRSADLARSYTMTVHAKASELGRRTCDAVLAAMRRQDPAAYCKHATNMCAFGVGAGPNFAYALHRKRAGSLEIFFPSTGNDSYEPLGRIEPRLRRTLGSAWADKWAWHFSVTDPTDAPDAVAFLFRFARTSGERRRAAQTRVVPLRRKPTDGRKLGLKDDHDIVVIQRASDVQMKRLHNQMTNALANLADGSISVVEGNRREAQFDALLLQYDGDEHDLLIEVKSSIDVPDVRLAVGQLLDYRRFLEQPEHTHLGVLLPSRPSAHVFAFADNLNQLFGRELITVYWFQSSNDLSTVWSARGRFLPRSGNQ